MLKKFLFSYNYWKTDLRPTNLMIPNLYWDRISNNIDYEPFYSTIHLEGILKLNSIYDKVIPSNFVRTYKI